MLMPGLDSIGLSSSTSNQLMNIFLHRVQFSTTINPSLANKGSLDMDSGKGAMTLSIHSQNHSKIIEDLTCF